MGDLAKMMNKFFRKLTAGMNAMDLTNPDEKAPTVILINQYREKIGLLWKSEYGSRGQRARI